MLNFPRENEGLLRKFLKQYENPDNSLNEQRNRPITELDPYALPHII